MANRESEEVRPATQELFRRELLISGVAGLAAAVPHAGRGAPGRGEDVHTSSFAILEAPSILGLFPKGVEHLPEALLRAGLAKRLQARHAGRLVPPPYNFKRDSKTLLLNGESIAAYSTLLADSVQDLREKHEFAVVLGGDCSILLGCMLGLRRSGRYGLLFLDGHADFYQPEAEPDGEVASMEVALATGRGPDLLSNLERRKPLVQDQDLVVLGRRDAAEADKDGSQRIENTGIEMLDLNAVRRLGVAECVTRAIRTLIRPGLHGFWIHLDADVLDDAIMPAVDYRMPNGLFWNEVSTVLAAAVRSGKAVGISIAIFNPSLDHDGSIARAFTDCICRGLRA